MEAIGQIDSQWGFYALALYLGIELIKGIIKKVGTKKQNETAANILVQKLEQNFISLEKRFIESGKKTEKALLRQEYLRLNSEKNILKNFDILCTVYEEYHNSGGNGYIQEIHEQNKIDYRKALQRKEKK